MKKTLLFLPLLLPLAACANGRTFLPPTATDYKQAKAAVPFCGTAKPSWGEAVDGDPGRTRAQKAAYNAVGKSLNCSGF